MGNNPAQKEFRDSLMVDSDTAIESESLKIQVYPYESASSTMDLAHELIRGKTLESAALDFDIGVCKDTGSRPNWALPKIQVVLARSQEAGRGRHRRLWQSPKDSGLYLSFIFPPPNVEVGLSGFSLALGLAVVDASALFGASAGLKWPNDVLVAFPPPRGFAKLSGILVEATPGVLQGSADGAGGIIAGIGVNLRSSPNLAEVNGVALDEIAQRDFTYLEVFREVAGAVLATVNQFYQVGFAPFAERWNSLSLMNGRAVIWKTGFSDSSSCRGCVGGVDSDGGLIVDTEDGRKVIYGGEVIFE